MQYPIQIFSVIGIAILLDITSGLVQACYNKTVSSEKLRNGIYHKLGYLFAIVLTLSLEYGIDYLDLGFEAPIFPLLAAYIVITEAFSVIENILKLNPELAESPLFNLLSSNQKRRKDD